MAGSDNATMVAAASACGVLGSLGAQYRRPAEISATIAEIRSKTNNPFAVNLFALGNIDPPPHDEIEHAKQPLLGYYRQFAIPEPTVEEVRSQIDPEQQLQVVLDEKVPVFSFTLGIPSEKWIKALKNAGTTLIGTATNVEEAIALEQAGVDAITVQGCEAGGHRGTFIGSYENSMIGLFALIPQIVDAVNVPVIAAGGIMDGRGIAAALALGAAGVQMGTAFLTVDECPVHVNYKKAVMQHSGHDTVITKVFSGGAARGITNEFIRAETNSPILPFPFHNSLTRPIRRVANQNGEIGLTNLWSGQAGKLARELKTKALVDALIRETEAVSSNICGIKLVKH